MIEIDLVSDDPAGRAAGVEPEPQPDAKSAVRAATTMLAIVRAAPAVRLGFMSIRTAVSSALARSVELLSYRSLQRFGSGGAASARRPRPRPADHNENRTPAKYRRPFL